MIGFSTATPAIVKAYNTFIRGRFVIPAAHPRHFVWQYARCRPVFARQFPWHFVRRGQTVLQVSSAKYLISSGNSQALILASVVGPSGRVVVVEPEPENASALRAYITRQRIGNMTVIERAVWYERRRMAFTVRSDRPGWHRLAETVDAESEAAYGTQCQRITVEADTIDHLVDELRIPEVAFINITINGSEHEALRGMPRLLERGVPVAFVAQHPRTVASPIFDLFDRAGYTVLLEHAPVSVAQRQFLVAVAVRNPPSEALGQYEPVTIEVADHRQHIIRITSARTGALYVDHSANIRWF